MHTEPAFDRITAHDSSQMYLLNCIAQTVIPDHELFTKTKVATEELAHRKMGEFEPITFTGEDAQMLYSGLRSIRDFPATKPEDQYVAHAAALMLDEQLHEYAREINDIPQQVRESELAAAGIGAWMDRVRSSREFDFTEQHSVEADMAEYLNKD